MVDVRIVRVETCPYDGTFGVLKLDGEAFCVTLEPYSRDNAMSVSCIPDGQYVCRKYSSVKYPETYEVSNVQGRSKILFHAGNTDDHTEGCILLGQYFGKMRGGDRAVLNSGKTFKSFLDYVRGVDEFRLTVESNY